MIVHGSGNWDRKDSTEHDQSVANAKDLLTFLHCMLVRLSNSFSLEQRNCLRHSHGAVSNSFLSNLGELIACKSIL